VEDKIIRRVRESSKGLKPYTEQYTAAFLEDLGTLNCLQPNHLPRATDFIPQIIELIAQLVRRGIAYQASDGSVYFSIDKYRGCGCRYGQLVNLNFDEMRVGERVASDEYAKESVADFALWKSRVAEDGDVFWESPWGQGRPGWHIECSAMSMALLGPSFDLHLGGEDLAFPHHEDEIAQSEGAGLQTPGKPFVKYWLHGAHLLVEGKKMSKTLGNFFTVRDLLTKGFNGREIRYLLLSAHYRDTFNFTLEGLEGARSALARIDECVAKLQELAGTTKVTPNPGGSPGALETQFTEAMDNDLNISAGWATVFDWVRETNRAIAAAEMDSQKAAVLLGTWERVNSVLGLGTKNTSEVPVEIQALVDERTAAKRARDFAKADAIRGQLKNLGWVIEDTPKGTKAKRG
jgi:cysteinyl-tRNA synthetase